MLKKEYTVFAAFLLINVLLSINCFTMSLAYKVEKQNKENSETQYDQGEIDVRKKWKENFETLNSANPVKSPEIHLIWTLRDSYTTDRLIRLTSNSFRNAICIGIAQNKNKYLDPDFSICGIWNDPLNSIHSISRELSEKVIEPRIDQIKEIILNPKYVDNIVLLLKDKTYLVINVKKNYTEEKAWELITTKNSALENFLNNSDGKLIRKKINTIIRINYKIYNKSYVSFIYEDKAKNRVVILEWGNIYDPSKDTKFIPLSLLYPVSVVMDIVLFPLGVLLFWTDVLPFSFGIH